MPYTGNIIETKPNPPSTYLGNLLPIMYEEMEYALDQELGNSHGKHPPTHYSNPPYKQP